MNYKHLILSLLTSSLLYAQNTVEVQRTNFKAPRLAGDSLPIAGFQQDTNASEVTTLSDAFSKGTVKGLIRYGAQHRDSNLHLLQDSAVDPSTKKLQQYSALGGYLGYETAPLFNTSVGATFYTSNAVGNNPNDRGGLGGLDDSGADGTQQESYTVLGEAYIKFKTNEHRLTYGRQEMPNYRFVSLSNIRMTPFTHEGSTYKNTMLKDFEFNLAYITKQKDRNAEQFEDMVRAARVKTGCGGNGINPATGACISGGGKALIRGSYDRLNYISGNYEGDNKAMTMLNATYKPENMSIELWNYYVKDFVNTAYLYADYTAKPNNDLTLTTAFQFASQNNVGSHVAGDINTWFYGVKAQASFHVGVTIFTAFNQVKYDENSYDGGTIFVRWGTPQMFNSYQVQDSELAGTKSIGIGAQFELGKMGFIPNTVIRFRYAEYDMPSGLTQTDARLDRTESTFDLRYSFNKNDGFGIFTQLEGLSLQLRLAYDDYESLSTQELNAYALEHGYDIPNVTKDFIDSRIYLDYMF